ncbi:hypothetical protein [Streptomyces sp. NPDC005336]|uniref:hypothetical protein n=1 Tax=Streptomyces sp. NPDC005336 TaxID=3157035 RepID=UPI0033BD4A28
MLLTPGVDFRDGAAHYLAERFRITEPRFGSVYGVRETQGFMISDSRSRVVFTDDEVPIAVLISENELTECEEVRAVVQRQLQSADDAHRVPDDDATEGSARRRASSRRGALGRYLILGGRRAPGPLGTSG